MASPTRLQATPKTTAAAATSIAMTFATPPAVGNALIVCVQFRYPSGGTAALPPTACSDNRGNSYALARQQDSSAGLTHAQRCGAAVYYCATIAATGAPFTVTVAGATGSYDFVGRAIEVAGGVAVDKVGGSGGSAAAPRTGNTGPATVSDLFLVAMHASGVTQTAITVETVSPAWSQEYEELNSTTLVAGEVDTRERTGMTGITTQCTWTVTATGYYAGVQVYFRRTTDPLPVPVVPTLSSVTPNTGSQGTTVPVTLTGTEFVAGSTTVAVSGAGVTVTGVSVGSATTLTASFTIAGGAAAGARSVTVTTAGGTSAAQAFTITLVGDGTSLLIGGRETTVTDLRAGSLRCELLLDARGKLACQLVDPPVLPTIGMDVLFTLDGVPFFGGIVVESTQTDGAGWSVTASDNMVILDGILINGVSPAGTLKSVLEWMVDISLGAYGFTVDAAQADGPALPSMSWPFQSYAEAFKQLGIQTEWTSVVSPTRVVRFYLGGAVPAPWTIDEDIVESLTVRHSREGHASGVWVRFGSGAPSDVTWSTVGDGVAVSWEVPYYVTTPPNVVLVNATTFPVLPYPDPGWSWEATFGEGILHAPVGDPPLTASDTITVTLTAAWPSVCLARTFEAPPIEIVVDYPDVFNVDVAQTLADGELARRAGYPRRFQLRTAQVGLQPGQSVTIDVPALDLDTTALVTGIRLAHVNTLAASGTIWWRLLIDLVEANASRGNWLTYWTQRPGGALGGPK